MGDFLNQDAIDDLISQIGDDSGGGGSSLGGGGDDFGLGDLGDLGVDMPAAPSGGGRAASPVVPADTDKDVRPYDFARASKFSKDQIRTIQMIHETFARLFASTLAAKIRALTKIKVVSVEEVTYEDFINTVSNPSIISIFSMPPMEGNAVLDISPQIGFPVMDRLLGGAGEEDEEARELTDIEVNIMESVLHDALGFIKEAWANVIDINPKLELLESNPYFVQVVPPSEMIVLVNLEAEVGEKTGRMNLAIPYVMLETVLPKLSIQQWFSTYRRTVSPDTPLKVEERLLKTAVQFTVQLGRTNISLKDFLNLGEGDIIQVNSKVSDELPIFVGDRIKFKGRPGVVGKRIAIQTTSVVKDVEEV